MRLVPKGIIKGEMVSLVVGETEVAVGVEEGVFGKRKPFLCHSRLRRLQMNLPTVGSC